MKGVRIKDRSERGFLNFDLVDLLVHVPENCRAASWLASEIWATMKEGESAPSEGDSFVWSWSELNEFSNSVAQTIDGRFEAKPTDDSPSLLIYAIDSSYWEVCSDNENFLSRLRKHFNEVETLSDAEVRSIAEINGVRP